MSARAVSPDRVLPATRAAAGAIAPILLIAFGLLYPYPADTERLFAWTIQPRMTPLVMGAGYLSGAYHWLRILTTKRWHRVGNGLLPTATFAWAMGIATILHWDRFHPGHVIFYAWVFLYAVTPLLLPALWLRNRREDDGRPEEGDVILGPRLRAAIVAAGVLPLALGLVLFVRPSWILPFWPWKLTPFTARVVAGWFALPGVLALSVARDPRWSALRIGMQAMLLGLALVILGVVRAWGDFDPARAVTKIYLAALAATALAVTALYVTMERRRRFRPA